MKSNQIYLTTKSKHKQTMTNSQQYVCKKQEKGKFFERDTKAGDLL